MYCETEEQYQSEIKSKKESFTNKITHQHRRAQIELVEELRDKYVYLQHIRHVLFLHIAQYIDEPLKVLMRRTDPKEVHFLARHS